jgi:cellulose synthase/poly-beta-1,6-N-acetylglucosamine synthase-like glycosyltransferase
MTERVVPPSASVVVCAYTLDRWDDLSMAIASSRHQTVSALEILLVVDHNDELLRRAATTLPGIRVIESTGPRGLSGARNTGVEAAVGEIVAFLDDDAAAEETWLEELVAPYLDRRVVGTGGHAEPAWETGRPAWWPREFDWVVGCSYRGLPARPAVVRNPLGCNMSFRRWAVLEAGGFRSGVGRIGSLPVGGEETELSIRLRRLQPDLRIVYVPAARVRHRVPSARATWRYFRSRCYQEGRSKALISSLAGQTPVLGTERSYTARTLPAGILAGFRDVMRGQPAGAARSMAIVAGLAMTAAGYGAARVGLDRIVDEAASRTPDGAG